MGGSPESLYGPRLVSNLDVDAEIICRIIPQARGARLHRVGRLNHRRQWLISDLEQFGSYRFWARTPPRLRKRHIVTDTCGLLVGAEVHPADVQDRDGAVLVIEAIHQLFPWLRHLFADSVYNGPKLREALAKFGDWTIEIVKRAADAAGFQLLPRRWVVERTLAWLNRNRRLAKDFEASIASAKAWVYIASVQLLIRRLA